MTLVPATVGAPLPRPSSGARVVPPPKPYSLFPTQKTNGYVKFVYVMWFILLCDPQWLVAHYTTYALLKIPTPFFALLLLSLFIKPPRTWLPSFVAFFLYTIATMAWAINRGFALGVVKQLLGFYVVTVAALSISRKPWQVIPIIAGAMMYSYIWWVVLGVRSGQVAWHPSLANYDGYGPLMSIGIGSCYYFALATKSKKEKRLGYAAAVGCLVGLISSFARGAVVAGVFVMFWMWVRSRQKLKATLAGIVALIAFVAFGIFFSGADRGSDSNPNFFTEMMSSTNPNDATRGDREVLWALARREFMDRPVLGVGANNFGPYAAQRFQIGDTGGGYDENPMRLYDRQLHSTFYQVLCEYGIVGSAIWLWMLGDFFWRNAKLRTKRFGKTFEERTGGRLVLFQLSLGLECALIAFLTSGIFYNQIFSVHWFYTIIGINSLLFYLAKPGSKQPAGAVPVPAR